MIASLLQGLDRIIHPALQHPLPGLLQRFLQHGPALFYQLFPQLPVFLHDLLQRVQIDQINKRMFYKCRIDIPRGSKIEKGDWSLRLKILSPDDRMRRCGGRNHNIALSS